MDTALQTPPPHRQADHLANIWYSTDIICAYNLSVLSITMCATTPSHVHLRSHFLNHWNCWWCCSQGFLSLQTTVTVMSALKDHFPRVTMWMSVDRLWWPHFGDLSHRSFRRSRKVSIWESFDHLSFHAWSVILENWFFTNFNFD